MTSNGATLSATGIHKAFGSNEVLKGVSLESRAARS
jgi:ABC-type histidine transport system ATPase subunit